MITQILIKQEAPKSKNFYLHVTGTEKYSENFSKFAFAAFTTQELHSEIRKVIGEFEMNSAYTIGVTVSNKIQVTLKKAA